MSDDRIRALVEQMPHLDSMSVYQDVMSRMGFRWWNQMPRQLNYPRVDYPITVIYKYGEDMDGNPFLNKSTMA